MSEQFTNTILIVDDNPENLKVLSNILKSENYNVRIAMNGEQALKSIKSNAPELVLLDIQMPYKDGYETCRELKANSETCDIPIIFISALSETIDKVKAFQEGAVDYIEKPFHADEVLARVKAHLTIEKQKIELQKSIKHLKKMQSKLFQSEKMASLGQLAAGVAHEINNPINFIKTAIEGIKLNIKDLFNIINKIEEQNEDRKDGIEAIKKEYDFNFIKEELYEQPSSALEGVNRTAEVVEGLRSFTSLDEDIKKPVDIHKNINNTLAVFAHTIPDNIKIIKSFGEIPEVDCYSGKMNQVFVNLITNAVEAIIRSGKDTGTIKIATSVEGSSVKISFTDNGDGISDEIKDKIFDPFFTTKDIGVGLGLSISHGIIDKHKGKINVLRNKESGTEFKITLPIEENNL